MIASQIGAAESRMIARLWLLIVLIACGHDATGVACETCAEVVVRTERGEYRPGEVVRFTITNRGLTTLRYDWCSMVLGRRTSETPFETVYRPGARCGAGAGIEEVVAMMQVIAPGETRVDSLTVASLFIQSQQRVQLWLVDVNGLPDGDPVVSNIFLVFPGAGARLGWTAR